MQVGAVRKGTDALVDAVLVDMNEKIEAQLLRHPIAKRDHLPELPRRVHMQERKWRLCRVERLQRQMQEYGRVLADRVKDNRVRKCRDYFSKDVNGFSFKSPKVGKRHAATPLTFLKDFSLCIYRMRHP
ncbi:hypothetical protein GCM10007864_38990 [Sinorhizobium fredii]|nr:hypothetical protein GCM10007864_38990 [Sinorhizobium fredii]